jgi:ADP-heptose:LPS heptosyltransferase
LPIAAVQSSKNRESVAALLQSVPTLKVISPEDIGKLTAIITSANLLLTTNNEGIYLAGAVGTYTIALLGGKDLKQVLPPSDRLRTIQSPTGAIADIAPQDVLEQIWK